MKIYGFRIHEEEGWVDDPFDTTANTPENLICEACHIYGDYIGFDINLELPKTVMDEFLRKYSNRLRVYEV